MFPSLALQNISDLSDREGQSFEGSHPGKMSSNNNNNFAQEVKFCCIGLGLVIIAKFCPWSRTSQCLCTCTMYTRSVFSLHFNFLSKSSPEVSVAGPCEVMDNRDCTGEIWERDDKARLFMYK